MNCDILDLRCVWVNELIGSQVLAVLIFGAFFFALCSKTRMGLKTSLWLASAVFPIVSYFIIGTSFVFAIVTFIAALSAALLHMRLVGNR